MDNQESEFTHGDSASPDGVGRSKRLIILLAAFSAWMFAGLEISLFVLIHRQMSLDILGSNTPENVITRWFAWYQASFLFGAAAGGWLFGWLGDRIGRTRTMGFAIMCYSLFTLACYFNNSADLMLLLRFLACLGVGGVWPNAVALVAEAWPDASRPFLAGLLGAAANVGFVILGAIGYVSPISSESWRWVFLVGASPALVGLAVVFLVPESAKWLKSRRERIEKMDSPLREVLRPPLLGRVALGVALGAIPVVGSAANANWLVPWADKASEELARVQGEEAPRKPDPRAKAKTQMTRSGGAIFGSLLGGIVASMIGRRLSYFLISLASLGVSSYIFTQLDPLHPQFQLFAFLLGFAGITYFGWLPLFLPELFPTRVRSTGAGISFNTGRIVAACVVLSAGLLLDRFSGDYSAVGFWSGTIYGVGMLLAFLIPRKAGGKLED